MLEIEKILSRKKDCEEPRNLYGVGMKIPWSLRISPALLAVLVMACREAKKEETVQNPTEESGTQNGPPVISALPEFSLQDQTGRRVGLRDLRGKVWVADFIFTRCEASCPQQTREKVNLQKGFEESQDLRWVSFTVDPEHDTTEVLLDYGKRFEAEAPNWIFLTGKREDLWNLSANGFKFEVADDARNSQMPILHCSDFALVDRQGRIRGIYDGLSVEGRTALQQDLNKVLKEKSPEEETTPKYVKLYHPPEVENPAWMKSREALQKAAVRRLEAFHEFGFEDVVERSGITFEHRIVDDAGKLYKAVHYDHGNGLALADVDGDGFLDLYFSTQIGSNELWRNRGDGTFENRTTPALALTEQIGVTASFGDTDNDGDPDLFVTTVMGGNRLLINDGTGQFADLTTDSGLGYVGHSSGGVFFDYDQDGLLDLFLCNVGKYTTGEKGTGGYCLGFVDAFEGHKAGMNREERSILYRNLGGNRFEDVSEACGLVDVSWTGDAAPLDYDGDGWVDLYVLSMQGNDQLYRNLEGKGFERVSREVFPKTPWGAMGIQVFDFDNDGNQDVFVTDMHSDMSQLVPPNQEKEKADMQWNEEMLMTKGASLFGNAFYRSLGNGRFEEISDQIGAENYWPWGLSAGDLNADGFTDVFITASMNFPFRYGVNSLLLNVNGKRFADCEYVLGVEPRRGGRTAKPWFRLDPDGEDAGNAFVEELAISRPTEIWGAVGSRSSAIFDFDRDGDLDIVTNEFHDRPMVLRSNLSEKLGDKMNWLGLRLEGTTANRDALGAVVRVTAGDQTFIQVHDGVSGYLSHGLIPLFFGLMGAERVVEVEVTWPGGAKSVLPDLATGKLHAIRQP
jgi:cytochrome oxidase Cu insertion factor (SCO1/SenC/PrrC family)